MNQERTPHAVSPDTELALREQYCVSSVQSLSHVWLLATTWTEAHQACLSSASSWSCSDSCSLSWWCHPVISSSHPTISSSLILPPSIFASIRVFSNESVLRIKWPKYWSFSFRISPSNEYSGLISFRIDRFGLLAVQETLKGLLQHHSSKASIIQCSAFFTVQLSHPYVTTGKTIALTRWIFVGKVRWHSKLLSSADISLKFKWSILSSSSSISLLQGTKGYWLPQGTLWRCLLIKIRNSSSGVSRFFYD